MTEQIQSDEVLAAGREVAHAMAEIVCNQVMGIFRDFVLREPAHNMRDETWPGPPKAQRRPRSPELRPIPLSARLCETKAREHALFPALPWRSHLHAFRGVITLNLLCAEL